MRPGTVDYSRWDSVGASDSDEEVAPPAPASMSRRMMASEAVATWMNSMLHVSDITADDVAAAVALHAAAARTSALFVQVVPLLLAHKAALRVAGAPAQESTHCRVFYSEDRDLKGIDGRPYKALPHALRAAMQPVMDAHCEVAAVALLSCVCRGARDAVTRVTTPEDREFWNRRFCLFACAIISALERSGPTARMRVVPELASMCAALASGPPADGDVSHGAALARAALEKQRKMDVIQKDAAEARVRSKRETNVDELLRGLMLVEMVLGDEIVIDVLGGRDTEDEHSSTQEDDDDADESSIDEEDEDEVVEEEEEEEEEGDDDIDGDSTAGVHES